MLRFTFMLMSLVAVVGVSVLTSASASASPGLSVCELSATTGGGQWANAECGESGGSKEYETKEATSGEIKGTGGIATLKGTLAKAEIIITCAKSVFAGEIKPAGAASGEVTFEGCEVGNSKEKFTNCEVPNIVFKFVSQLIETETDNIKDEFKPPTGEEFVKIKIKNKGEKVCAEKSEQPVVGSQIALIPNPLVLKLSHLIDFSTADSKLKFAGETATFEESVTLYVLVTSRSESRYVYFHFV